MLRYKFWITLFILSLFSFVTITTTSVVAQEHTASLFYNTILANNNQTPSRIVPTGIANTSIEPACQNLIDGIVRCNSGNGSCVVLKFRKADNPENPNYNKLTENAKKCAGSNSSILSENQKLDLINKVCLVLPADSSSDRTFFCQACIGRGVTKPSSWSDQEIVNKCNSTIPANNSSRKLVNRKIDQNGQVKEVLATRINVKERSPGSVASATEDNFYLTVANQLANPFSNQSNFVLANTQSQQKTLIIEASGISNVVPGPERGIEKSQGEICTFSFFPGAGWKVVSPPPNGITNKGVCETEVTIEPVVNQAAFLGFGGTPVWAQGGSNQPGVEVCVYPNCASVNLNVVGQVIADASTNILNFFGNQCFFPNQALSSDGTVVCTPNQALSVRIFRFILNVAPAVAFTVALFASFLLLIGKEKEGRSWLGKAIIGLLAIFAITTIVGLIEQSIEAKNVNPITNFVIQVVNSFIIPLASIVSLIYFIIGSYKVTFSGTDETQVKEGWQYMRNAIIGFVIVLLSFSLAQLIINLFLFVSSTL